MSTVAPIVVFLSLVSTFLVASWGVSGRVAAHDRSGLISGAITAVTGFAVASVFINWVETSIVVWWAGVALCALGIVGAALRWSQVPWFQSARPALRAVVVVPYWSICALVIGVAFT